MKKMRILMLVAALLSIGAGSLNGGPIFDTGPFTCDRQVHTLTWVNPFSFPIYIKTAHIWMGMTYNTKADFFGHVYRASDGFELVTGRWDHYGNPIGIADGQWTETFSPDYVLLSPGVNLNLDYSCDNIEAPGGIGGQGHIKARIGFMLEP